VAWCGGGVVAVVKWLREGGAWHGGDDVDGVRMVMVVSMGLRW
ncbi:hypothetical protein Tco_1339010, partial [Tanacetum coccineum]